MRGAAPQACPAGSGPSSCRIQGGVCAHSFVMRWRAAPGSPPRVDGKTDGSPRKTLVICRFLQNLSAHRSVCRALRSKSQRGCIIFFTASLAYARLCGALRDDILRHRLALPKTARPACCRRSGDVCKLVHRADYDVDNNPSGLQMKHFMPRWRAMLLRLWFVRSASLAFASSSFPVAMHERRHRACRLL